MKVRKTSHDMTGGPGKEGVTEVYYGRVIHCNILQLNRSHRKNWQVTCNLLTSLSGQLIGTVLTLSIFFLHSQTREYCHSPCATYRLRRRCMTRR